MEEVKSKTESSYQHCQLGRLSLKTSYEDVHYFSLQRLLISLDIS